MAPSGPPVINIKLQLTSCWDTLVILTKMLSEVLFLLMFPRMPLLLSGLPSVLQTCCHWSSSSVAQFKLCLHVLLCLSFAVLPLVMCVLCCVAQHSDDGMVLVSLRCSHDGLICSCSVTHISSTCPSCLFVCQM